MRIVAGKAKGTRLYGATGRRVRPMLDRVKESLFEIIDDAVRDARVLDLFAGVGTLGIEALSRGAGSADFVEYHAPTARHIETNLRRAHLEDKAKVHIARLPGGLRRVRGEYNLIFVDPPFRIEKRLLEEIFDRIDQRRLLASDGYLVYRGYSGNVFEPLGERWELVERREYGDSTVSIYKLKGRE